MTAPITMPDQPPLVTLVHKQLAALESLAVDGHGEAAALRSHIAALAGQLNDAATRLARLEATLQSHAQLLSAIRAGLTQMPAAAPPPVEREAPTPQPPAPPEPAPVAPAAQSPAPVVPAPPPAPVAQSVAPAPPAIPAPAARPAAEPLPAPAPPAPSNAPIATTPIANLQSPTSPSGPQVQRGSRVRVVFDDDTSETYTIVRQEETNRQRNLIGENSPLGAALLGATIGELRSFRVRPAGPEQMVEVLEIS